METLSNLKRLEIIDNNITELKGLKKLRSLKELRISGNRISEIKGIETLSNLKSLCLSGNNLYEIKGLENLERLESLNQFYNNRLEIEIDSNSKKIDSNHWVIQILNEIKANDKYFNYQMIIDNEGLNIKYETIKSIREIHNYGDIIITLQDAGIKRNLKPNPQKGKEFFGIKIPPSTKKEDLCDIYINQLHNIGLKNVEKLNITSESGFYYTLLFCCRSDVEAKWLKMIEYYRDERFENWTDSDVKKMWLKVKLNH